MDTYSNTLSYEDGAAWATAYAATYGKPAAVRSLALQLKRPNAWLAGAVDQLLVTLTKAA